MPPYYAPRPAIPAPNLAAMATTTLGMQEPAQAMMGQVQTDPILDSLKLKKPGLFSKNNIGNALGIIGDALMAYGGMQPTFGPMKAKERELAQERDFDREKLNAMLEYKRQEARFKAANPTPTQTDRYVQEVLDPQTPPQRRALLQAILTRPFAVTSTGPDGSQSSNYYYPGQTTSGDDDWEYSN